MPNAARPSSVFWVLVSALVFAGCDDDDPVSRASASADSSDFQVSAKNDVLWKRQAALENDLARALELEPASLCVELGRARCTEVHLMPLGGNDPFESGIFVPAGEPLATTPAVIDRVLLSACGQRARLDREAPPGQAVVFRELDLNGPAPSPDDARVAATVAELYRRLLSRDPSPEETSVVSALALNAASEPIAAAELATLSCFAVGGSTEFLFY
jgi:hypothetical protein